MFASKKLGKNENSVAYLFMLPLVIMFLVFLAYPILKVIIMSFQYWYMSKPKPEGHYFVGFQNYIEIFKDVNFINSIKRTFVFITITVIIRYIIGLGIALLLNKQYRGKGIFRAINIIPWAMPQVVVCLVFVLMLDTQVGVVNYILNDILKICGNIDFLGKPGWAFFTANLVTIWKGFPFVSIMLLAGLQSIPNELYEASIVDGANSIQKFRHITLPMLKPVSVIVFLLLIIWTIKDFSIVYVLAYGGPSRATEIITIYVYNLAFKYFDFGKASAAGMVMLVFSMIFTVFYLKALREGEYE
jgi:multiple sugar transport system permease protein